MRKPDITNNEIIDLLADGHTVSEITLKTGCKKFAIQRRIERLRQKYSCKNITQLVVKFKLSGSNTTNEQPI